MGRWDCLSRCHALFPHAVIQLTLANRQKKWGEGCVCIHLFPKLWFIFSFMTQQSFTRHKLGPGIGPNIPQPGGAVHVWLSGGRKQTSFCGLVKKKRNRVHKLHIHNKAKGSQGIYYCNSVITCQISDLCCQEVWVFHSLLNTFTHPEEKTIPLLIHNKIHKVCVCVIKKGLHCFLYCLTQFWHVT